MLLLGAAGLAEAGQELRTPGVQRRPPVHADALRDGARPPGHLHHARPPGHLHHARPTPPPPPGARPDAIADRSQRRSYAAQLPIDACEPGAADISSGPALAAYLQSIPDYYCFQILFNGPEDVRRAAFHPERVRYVFDTIAKLAITYDGTNSTNLEELFHFARAAFFNAFYYEFIAFPEDVYQAMMEALDEFIQNPHFHDVTDEHGAVLTEVFVVVDSIGHGYRTRYLPVVKDWLGGFGAQHAESWYLNVAANELMFWFFRGHRDDAFLEVALADTELVGVLRDLALSDSLLYGARADLRELVQLLMKNAALEFARFMSYESAPVAPTIRDGVQRILSHYDPFGEGASMWLAAASHVYFNDACADYGICGARDEIENTVLSIEHSCGGAVVIRAQDMTPEQLLTACDQVSEVEVFFHDVLRTNHEPLPGDMNAILEVIVYKDWENYDRYSPFLFDHETDNGGLYAEGDPSDPDNVARFFAHIAPWLPDQPVWNLRHEYVHYLDGRYNLAGGWSDVKPFSHKTLWWVEGLAEYIWNLGGSSEVLDEYLTGHVSRLDEIFPAPGGYSDLTLYPRSHLAMWFLFEEHREEIDVFLEFFGSGDYDGYLDYLNDAIGGRYEDGWRQWVGSLVTSATTN